MSYIDEVSSNIPTKYHKDIELLIQRVWNGAIARAAATAEKCYYGDDDGFEPMSPSTIAEHIRHLSKAG